MRNLVGLGVIGLVSIGAAQAPALAHGPGVQTQFHGPRSGLGCPVAMSARRTPNGAVAYAGGAEQDPSQNGVHVNLMAQSGARIREASLTVHALTAQRRLLAVASGVEPDVAKDFQLTAGKQGAPELGGQASVDGQATVVFVDVRELVYADGRVWRPAAGVSCRVEPDSFLPVASAH